jgi:hypothetical protein
MLLSDENSDALRLCFQASESSLNDGVDMNFKNPQQHIDIGLLHRFFAALYACVQVREMWKLWLQTFARRAAKYLLKSIYVCISIRNCEGGCRSCQEYTKVLR